MSVQSNREFPCNPTTPGRRDLDPDDLYDLGPDLCEIHLNLNLNTINSEILAFFHFLWAIHHSDLVVEGVCSACEDDFQMWLPMCREGSANGEFLQFGAGRWS